MRQKAGKELILSTAWNLRVNVIDVTCVYSSFSQMSLQSIQGMWKVNSTRACTCVCIHLWPCHTHGKGKKKNRWNMKRGFKCVNLSSGRKKAETLVSVQGRNQWCADKCLTAALWKRKSWCVLSANLYDVKTPIMTKFKLRTKLLDVEWGRDVHNGLNNPALACRRVQ